MEEVKLFRCDCYSEGVVVEPWEECDGIFLAFWQYGYYKPSFTQRLKYIWKIIKDGTPYTDMVCFNKEKAIEFAKYILSELDNKNKK
jgi:hypothetical protein